MLIGLICTDLKGSESGFGTKILACDLLLSNSFNLWRFKFQNIPDLKPTRIDVGLVRPGHGFLCDRAQSVIDLCSAAKKTINKIGATEI